MKLSFEPDHPRVARDFNNLAHLLPAIQRLSDGEALSDRITEILFNIPPPATNILT
jgi:hypothetical protein